MIMTTWQGVVTVLMAVLGTIITRFLPFVLFPESKKPPHIIDYLGNVLPYAMTGSKTCRYISAMAAQAISK